MQVVDIGRSEIAVTHRQSGSTDLANALLIGPMSTVTIGALALSLNVGSGVVDAEGGRACVRVCVCVCVCECEEMTCYLRSLRANMESGYAWMNVLRTITLEEPNMPHTHYMHTLSAILLPLSLHASRTYLRRFCVSWPKARLRC